MPTSLTPQHALIYTMVTMSAVDRDMNDVELARIGDLSSRMPVFEGFDSDTLIQLAQECGEVVAREDGLSDVLEMISSALP